MSIIKHVSDHVLSGDSIVIEQFLVTMTKPNQLPTKKTDDQLLTTGLRFSPSFKTTLAHLRFFAATKGCLALSVDRSTDTYASARVEKIIFLSNGNLEGITQNATFLAITKKPTTLKKLWWKMKRLYHSIF